MCIHVFHTIPRKLVYWDSDDKFGGELKISSCIRGLCRKFFAGVDLGRAEDLACTEPHWLKRKF